MRIGHGYDVHAFSSGDHITLGGVKIPYSQGFAAHSDGDVLIHAVCDALLGAAALGDIGQHFPDTDPRYQDADSRMLLRRVVSLLREQNLSIINLDTTVIAQAPKLAAHIKEMRTNLANDMDIKLEQVSIKATTTEGLGFTGRGEGIAAHAVTLLGAVS